MTVSSTTTRNSYTGDGTTTVFAYTFKIFDDDDITVILRTTATGTETVQTKTTDYSVSGVGDTGGGNITFGTPPTAAQTVVLLRQTAQTQTTDYTPNDPFPAASHEDALDKLTLIQQDQQDELDRAIKLSRTNTMTSTEFTVGASDRANKILAFDSSGELAVTQEIGTFTGDWASGTSYQQRDIIKDTSNDNIYIANTAHTSSGSEPISSNTDSAKWDLLVDAAAAATSATAAASSATAAAASATAAASSASAAATSETNAAASEAGVAADAAAAAASASSASTSATNASTSETNAATSASAASTSASNAATSATSASNSATSASTSASNAATSETNASNSASAASTSASNAATSETNAATSETNAATSASSAASDASAAASSAAAAAASFDAFDDIYLGAKASAPTVDNDGDALTAGDQYFNTTNSTLFVWNGSAWQAASPDIVGDTTPQLGGNLDTNGNDINFGDNDKAVFGAGSDLQIYHNGSHSYIEDQGTGNLYVKATNLRLNNSANVSYLSADSGGAVSVYHNGSQKLATTATGADITGTLTADGLTVEGSTTPTINIKSTDAVVVANDVVGAITFEESDATGGTGVQAFIKAIANDSGNTYDMSIGVGGNTEAIRIDQSGSVGINTSSPTEDLHIKGKDGAHADVIIEAYTGYNSGLNFNDNAGMAGRIVYNHSSNFMEFDTNGSERLRITSDGSVGIGVTAPSGKLHLSESGATNQAATIFSLDGYDSTFGANLAKSSGTYTTPAVSLSGGGWEYQPVNSLNGHGVMIYLSAPDTNTSASTPLERLRIDGSGNFMCGKTAVNVATAGVEARSDGLIAASRSASTPMFVNRLSDDGTLLNFRKDNLTVGSVESDAGRIRVISEGSLLLRQNDTTQRNIVFSSTYFGTDTAGDATVDLGRSAGRFKDLYLSGGVYLGGSGSANLLDDYEEGTWTPVLGGVSGTSGQTYSLQAGRYTKVGRQVICSFEATLTAVGTVTGSAIISGLPFTSAGTATNLNAGGTSITFSSGFATNQIYVTGYLINGETRTWITGISAAGTSINNITATNIWGNSTRVSGVIKYTTA